jgi:(2Fe-2S) ferredoxin
MLSDRTILVCQGRCCRKNGSKNVLTAFQSQTPPGTKIIPCSCLGKCGNGTTVLVLQEKICYPTVQPKDISFIYNSLKLSQS